MLDGIMSLSASFVGFVKLSSVLSYLALPKIRAKRFSALFNGGWVNIGVSTTLVFSSSIGLSYSLPLGKNSIIIKFEISISSLDRKSVV